MSAGEMAKQKAKLMLQRKKQKQAEAQARQQQEARQQAQAAAQAQAQAQAAQRAQQEQQAAHKQRLQAAAAQVEMASEQAASDEVVERNALGVNKGAFGRSLVASLHDSVTTHSWHQWMEASGYPICDAVDIKTVDKVEKHMILDNISDNLRLLIQACLSPDLNIYHGNKLPETTDLTEWRETKIHKKWRAPHHPIEKDSVEEFLVR